MSEPRIVARVRDADLLAGVKAAAATYRARLTHWTDALISASDLADANLVVLEAANSNVALNDFQIAKDACPKAEVVVLATAQTTPEDVRRLFRAGARDVLAAPVAEEQLISAVGEAIGPSTVGQGHGLVVCVVKSAGGVGATTLAVNLAGHFANPPRTKRGDRLDAMKVALLDFDIQFGDIALALDIEPRKTIADILRTPKRLDSHFLDGVLERHRSGVRVLAAPLSTAPIDAIDGDVATALVNVAASSHELGRVERIDPGASPRTTPEHQVVERVPVQIPGRQVHAVPQGLVEHEEVGHDPARGAALRHTDAVEDRDPRAAPDPRPDQHV